MGRFAIGILLCVACKFTPAQGTASDADPGDDALRDGDTSVDASADGEVDAEVDAPPAATIVQTGLIQDLNADLGRTGDPIVTAWANQASGGDDVATGAGAVTVVANTANGHAVLVFDGKSRMVGNNTNVFQPLTNGAGLTWFAVVQPGAQDSATRNQIIGTIREGGSFSGFTAGVNMPTARPYTMMRPTTTETFVQSTRDISGLWVVLAGRLSTGTGSQTAEVYVNQPTPDKTAAVNVPGGSTCGALVIGAERSEGTEFFTGSVARILIYDRALSNAERDQTGRALGELYGIATLF
jgi:hypothetical protein